MKLKTIMFYIEFDVYIPVEQQYLSMAIRELSETLPENWMTYIRAITFHKRHFEISLQDARIFTLGYIIAEYLKRRIDQNNFNFTSEYHEMFPRFNE